MVTIVSATFAQKKGDSLAILYYRVYAYENPGDLSTRISVNPLSYRDKNKLVFIEDSDEYPGYFKVKTHEGVIAYVKSNRLSTNQSLSHKQIKKEIEEGSRFKFYGVKYKIEGFNYPWWYYVIGFIVLLIIASRFYLKYKILDTWYCKKARSQSKPLEDPWFIKYALISGIVIGMFQLFLPGEFTWFRMEGVQIWGSYPNYWDWILWASIVSIILVSLLAIIQAFQRFSFIYALIYSVISLIIIVIYFLIGGMGSILIALLLMIKYGSGGGGGGANQITVGGVNYTRTN